MPRMLFFLLTNVKMPTVVGILTFISRKSCSAELIMKKLKPRGLVLFSVALVVLAKSKRVHSIILHSHLFFSLPRLLFFLDSVSCRTALAKYL